MSNATMLKECICPLDCEYVRYAINEKEEIIDPHEYCEDLNNVGRIMTELMNKDRFIFRYKMIKQSIINDSSLSEFETYDEQAKKMCQQIMQTDLAVVRIRLESNKYILTVMDKRLTFADKLASFGKEYANKYISLGYCVFLF